MTTTHPTDMNAHVVTPDLPAEPKQLDPTAVPAVAEVFGKAVGPVTETTSSQTSRVVDCDEVPWTPFPMPGTSFKLLNINETSGSSTVLLYVSEGAEAPLHRHVGAAEAYNILGRWAYLGEDGVVGPNTYIYEPAGITHLPQQESESLMFGVFHGPIIGYDEDGSIAGVIDADLLWNLAEANGAVAHLPARTNQ